MAAEAAMGASFEIAEPDAILESGLRSHGLQLCSR
jgi:hypothetical protein